MKSRIICVLLVVLFVFSSNAAYAAVELSNSYKIDEGVTLRLPKDWTEISREAIDEMAEIMANNLGTAVPKYNFAFQLEDAALFDYPYMLVLINKTGRVSESEFSNLKRLENEMDQAFDSVEKKMDSMIGDIDIGEQVYDAAGKKLISKMRTDVDGVGGVFMMMDLQLTSSGFIQFMLYCEESDYDLYNEIFAQITDSIEITGNARYSISEGEQGGESEPVTAAADQTAEATEAAEADNTIDAADADAASGTDTVLEAESGTGTGTETDGAQDSTKKAGKNALSPLLIAVIILAAGIIVFVILRGNNNKQSAANTPKGGYSDWFCPKCRHGNPASTSVCQNCNHSLV